MSLVTIPALTTIVDRQFKEDRTLCPVRALRYYLDRTKDPRGSQSLLFISFNKGHTSDIRPAALSWLNKPLYFVINKHTNKPWTWSNLKRMTFGPSRPLRPFTVGYRWTKSCKPVTGKLTTHLQIFTYKTLLGQAQQVLDPSSETSCPRKEKRVGGGGTSATTKSSGV